MRAGEAFRMGLRSLKERPLETGLIVLGIALASCVAAASLILLRNQGAQTERILQGPALREIVVRAARPDEAQEREQVAASAIDTTRDQLGRVSLDDTDVKKALEAAPGVKYAYRYESSTVRVAGGGGFYGGPGGAGAGRMAVAIAEDGRQGAASASSGAASSGSAPTGSSSGSAPTGAASAPTGSSSAPTGSSSGATGSSSGATAGRDFPAGDGPPDEAFGAAMRERFGAAEKVPEGVVLLKPALDAFRQVETSPGFFEAYGVGAEYGSTFTEADAKAGKSVAVLGASLAAQLFPEVPAAELVGRKAQIQGRIWTIIGVLGAEAGRTAIASGTALSELAFTPAAIVTVSAGGRTVQIGRGMDSMRFAVADSADLEAARVALQAYFDGAYGAGRVSITVPFEAVRLSREGFQGLLWIVVAFGVGALAMALINLMNMMLTRALRRQGQIGILAAMGCSKRDLAALQLLEGGLMAVVGTLLGFFAAIPVHGLLLGAGASLFGMEDATAAVDPLTLAVLGPALVAAALLLALVPAVQISRQSISDALKSE